jgi:hypothetical protein
MSEHHQENESDSLLLAAAFLRNTRLDHTSRQKMLLLSHHFDWTSFDSAKQSLVEAFEISSLQPVRFAQKSYDRALITGRRWKGSGIKAIRIWEIPALETDNAVFFCRGDISLLKQPTAAILNSRKGIRISPEDAWISRAAFLTERVISEGAVLITSFGAVQYDLVSVLMKGREVIVVCDNVLPFMDCEKPDTFLSDYKQIFNLDRTLFVSTYSPGIMPDHKIRRLERDELIIRLAGRLYECETTKGGNIDTLVKSNDCAHKLISTPARKSAKAFASGSVKEKKPFAEPRDLKFDQRPPPSEFPDPTPKLDHPEPNSQNLDRYGSYNVARNDEAGFISNLSNFEPLIIHYTRFCRGPWPGETIHDYCVSLIEGAPKACHSGLFTLSRIISEKLVRASSRLIRGATPVVSLTECLPDEMRNLRKWRRGLIRWSFEPYGLAFPKQALLETGVYPVIYAPDSAFRYIPEELKYLFQLDDSGTAWVDEKEWRKKGDLNIPPELWEKTIAITPTVSEAKALIASFGLKVHVIDAPHDLSRQMR